MASDGSGQGLPNCLQIEQAFQLYNPKPSCDPQVQPDGSLLCSCMGCQRWQAFLHGDLLERQPWAGPPSHHPGLRQYEVLTQELIAGLAAYLRLQAAAYALPLLRILELGGGDGRLSHHLRHALSPDVATDAQHLSSGVQSLPFNVTCTDSGAAGLHSQPSAREVVIVPYEVALQRADPHIVLCCWQPLGVDWTQHIRDTASVLEYILIGQADSSMCGDALLTWGTGAKASQAPYKQFVRHRVEEVADYQICCLDERWLRTRHSSTWAFRRGQAG